MTSLLQNTSPAKNKNLDLGTLNYRSNKGAGSGGADGAPQLRKHDIINIHRRLNLRRMLKENDNFVILMQ